MPHTTGFARALAVGCLAALSAAPVAAAEEDTQFWSSLTVAGPLGENLTGSAELEVRARSDDRGGEQVLTRATAEYRLNPAVSVGGGLAYAEFDVGHEWRPFQQVIVRSGVLTFRTRLEQRFFSGADRMELRLRQRVQAGFPLAEDTTFTVAGEVLGTLQSRNSGQDAQVEQWRAQLALRHRVLPHIEAMAGYQLLLTPRIGREDRLSHVPQIALTIRQ
jgi:hypothetical protein